MGTEETENDLNIECDDYEHIKFGFDLAPTDWNMLRFIEHRLHRPNANFEADWLDAIVVAMDYLKKKDPPKSQFKIVLLTTFTSDIDTGMVDTVIDQLRVTGIELIVM